MMHDFDSYLPTYRNQIGKRLSPRREYYDDHKVIRYMDVRNMTFNEKFRFSFHLPKSEQELFAGVLFAHTLLSQIIHFHQKEFPYIHSISDRDERQILFPEIIVGLLSAYDMHVCPTMIPLAVLYVDELENDFVPYAEHLSLTHAITTWSKKHKVFEESIEWLKLNLTEKVVQLTGVTILQSDKQKLLALIDMYFERFNEQFGYSKTWWINHYSSVTWKYIKKIWAFSWRFLLIYLVYKYFIIGGQFGRLASLFDIRTEGYDIYQQLEPYQVRAVSLIYLILRLEDVIALLLISLTPRFIVTDMFFRVNKVLTDLEWRIGFRLVALLVLCMAFNVPWRFF
jgi:hypothetical protein